MSERYHAKRRAGLSDVRRDGSRYSPELDRQAEAAERFAAGKFGATFNDDVYDDHGDDGHDFVVVAGGRETKVDVVWLGFADGCGLSTRPRLDGHLIVNPEKHEPRRAADVYVLVLGTIAAGFTVCGWISRTELATLPPRDFGYGVKTCAPIGALQWFRRGLLHE